MMFGIGLAAGLAYATQNSTYRLLGLSPNDIEVRKYGVVSDEALEEFRERSKIPNIEFISTPKFRRE